MHVNTDLLLIGGGSAGCLAAIAARAHSPTVAVTILEKGGALSRSVFTCSSILSSRSADYPKLL